MLIEFDTPTVRIVRSAFFSRGFESSGYAALERSANSYVSGGFQQRRPGFDDAAETIEVTLEPPL
jgi:hypothetical protein